MVPGGLAGRYHCPTRQFVEEVVADTGFARVSKRVKDMAKVEPIISAISPPIALSSVEMSLPPRLPTRAQPEARAAVCTLCLIQPKACNSERQIDADRALDRERL